MKLEVFRKEIKYLVSLSDFCRIEPVLGACLCKDQNDVPGGYLVRSLYFDNYDDKDCYDVLDGVESKQKIRIRVYGPDALTAKLEFKCKTGTDGWKQSLDLTRREAEAMVRGEYGFLQGKEDPGKELFVRMTQEAYLPRTVVEYRRSAYIYPVNNIRVTFDEKIAASFDKWALFETAPCYEPVLPFDTGVLEVKYDGFLPEFIKDIVRGINALPAANSKYVQSRLIL